MRGLVVIAGCIQVAARAVRPAELELREREKVTNARVVERFQVVELVGGLDGSRW
jgi:hypothetical protein